MRREDLLKVPGDLGRFELLIGGGDLLSRLRLVVGLDVDAADELVALFRVDVLAEIQRAQSLV